MNFEEVCCFMQKEKRKIVAPSQILGDIKSKNDLFSMLADLVKFYEGGLSYEYAKSMSIDEAVHLNREARRINKEIKAKNAI